MIICVLVLGCSTPIEEQAENLLDRHGFTPTELDGEGESELRLTPNWSDRIASSLSIGLDPRPYDGKMVRFMGYNLVRDEGDYDQCVGSEAIAAVMFSGTKMIAAWKQADIELIGGLPSAYSLDEDADGAPKCANDS